MIIVEDLAITVILSQEEVRIDLDQAHPHLMELDKILKVLLEVKGITLLADLMIVIDLELVIVLVAILLTEEEAIAAAIIPSLPQIHIQIQTHQEIHSKVQVIIDKEGAHRQTILFLETKVHLDQTQLMVIAATVILFLNREIHHLQILFKALQVLIETPLVDLQVQMYLNLLHQLLLDQPLLHHHQMYLDKELLIIHLVVTLHPIRL